MLRVSDKARHRGGSYDLIDGCANAVPIKSNLTIGDYEIRDFEDSTSGINLSRLANATGKQDLGNGVQVGIGFLGNAGGALQQEQEQCGKQVDLGFSGTQHLIPRVSSAIIREILKCDQGLLSRLPEAPDPEWVLVSEPDFDQRAR